VSELLVKAHEEVQEAMRPRFHLAREVVTEVIRHAYRRGLADGFIQGVAKKEADG